MLYKWHCTNPQKLPQHMKRADFTANMLWFNANLMPCEMRGVREFPFEESPQIDFAHRSCIF